MEPSLKKRRRDKLGLQNLYSALRNEVISYLKFGTELVAFTLSCRAFRDIVPSAIQELTVTSSWSHLTHPTHLPRVTLLRIDLQKTGHWTLIQVLRASPNLNALQFLGRPEPLNMRPLSIDLVRKVTDLDFGRHWVDLDRDIPQPWPAVRTLQSRSPIVNTSQEFFPALQELCYRCNYPCPRGLFFAPELKTICLFGRLSSLSHSHARTLRRREKVGLSPVKLLITCSVDIAQRGAITLDVDDMHRYVTDMLLQQQGGFKNLPPATHILTQLHVLTFWPRLRSFHSLGQFAVISENGIFRVEVAAPELYSSLRRGAFWNLHPNWRLVRVAQEKLWKIGVDFLFLLDDQK